MKARVGAPLVPVAQATPAELDVVVFPGAGSGPSAFAGWRRFLPAGWRLAVANLPGREGRVDEPFAESIPAAAGELVSAVSAWRDRSIPAVYIGHSLGGWLAFEVALSLPPDLLVPVACPAEHGPLHYAEPDAALLRAATYEQGQALHIDTATLDEMVDTTLRVMLGDTRTANGYRPATGRLGCDVVACYGRQDPTPRRSWSCHTTGRAELAEFDGDHHFVKRRPRDVLDHVAAAVLHAGVRSTQHRAGWPQ